MVVETPFGVKEEVVSFQPVLVGTVTLEKITLLDFFEDEPPDDFFEDEKLVEGLLENEMEEELEEDFSLVDFLESLLEILFDFLDDLELLLKYPITN